MKFVHWLIFSLVESFKWKQIQFRVARQEVPNSIFTTLCESCWFFSLTASIDLDAIKGHIAITISL